MIKLLLDQKTQNECKFLFSNILEYWIDEKVHELQKEIKKND